MLLHRGKDTRAQLFATTIGVFKEVILRAWLRFLRRRNRDEGFVPEGSMLMLFSLAAIGHMIVSAVAGLVLPYLFSSNAKV